MPEQQDQNNGTTVVQQDGAPPHFHTGLMLFSHSATQKEDWTYGTYCVAPRTPQTF